MTPHPRFGSLIACFFFAAYVLSYAVLSSMGEFELTILFTRTYTGTGEWFPKGFSGSSSHERFSALLRKVYQPLYALDVRFWHKPRSGIKLDPDQPIHLIPAP